MKRLTVLLVDPELADLYGWHHGAHHDAGLWNGCHAHTPVRYLSEPSVIN